MAENEDSLSDADLLKSYSHEQTEAALTPPPKRSRLHSTENLAPEEADVKLNEISHVADYTDNQTEAVDAQAALKENTPPESDVSFESPSAGKTEKSPRNAFAVRGDTARQRFNLDQKKAQKDVKSRLVTNSTYGIGPVLCLWSNKVSANQGRLEFGNIFLHLAQILLNHR